MSEENKNQEGQTGQEGGNQELIAGKFKSQEELVASYKQLEQKLHSKQQEPKAPEPSNPSPEKYAWKETNEKLDARHQILEQRKKEADSVLSNPDTLQSVRAALGSQEAIQQFQKDFDDGHVSAAEVKRLAAVGGKPKESTESIPQGNAPQQGKASEQDIQWMMANLKDPDGVYFDPQHPDHQKVKLRVEQIRNSL